MPGVRGWTGSAAFGLLAIVSGACARTPPESSPGDAGGPGASDGAGAEAEGASGPSPLSAIVFERGWPALLALTTTPLAGVLVAADLPDGSRQEATTDATGTVSFPNVDWSKGTASVTAYRKGSPLETRLGITQDHASQRLWVRAIPPPMITVIGSPTNYDPTSKYLVVKSPQGPNRYQNIVGLPYSIQVPQNTAFSLYAATFQDNSKAASPREENSSYTGFVRRDFPASSQDIANADLDFSQPLPQFNTTGTIEFPPNPNSPLFTDSQPYFQVSRSDNVGFFGAPVLTTISADGASCAYQGVYVHDDDVTDITTDYQLYVGAGFSFVRLHAYPADGAVVSGFLEQPQIVQPADPAAAATISDPIIWQVLDADSRGTLLLDETPGPGIIWEINSVSPVPVITVPSPPSAVDRAATFGTAPLRGFLQLGVDCDPPEDFGYASCNRGTVPTTPLFLVEPP
jgi:hypothetical protein